MFSKMFSNSKSDQIASHSIRNRKICLRINNLPESMSLFSDEVATPPESPSGKSSAHSTPELSRLDSSYALQTSAYDFNSASFGTQELFIGICGLIGAGKTTLAEALAQKMNLPVYYEPVADNIYLEDFYGDMAKYAFPLQIYLLNKRFKQQQQIVWGGKGGVQDRTIYEDCVFAKMLADSGLMDRRDYSTYIELFQNMSNFMKKPNIIVHLELSPEEAMERIISRARGCEVGISLEYLQALHHAYDEFIREIAKTIPVIKVDYSSFRTVDEMTKRILAEYEKIANIRVVEW